MLSKIQYDSKRIITYYQAVTQLQYNCPVSITYVTLVRRSRSICVVLQISFDSTGNVEMFLRCCQFWAFDLQLMIYILSIVFHHVSIWI